MPPLKNLLHQRFGKLLVIAEAPRTKQGKASWWVRCDCGSEKIVRASSLVQEQTRACGCLVRESQHRVTHGGSSLPEYRIWKHMRARCLNETDAAFVRYGGRGIKICKRWESFAAFYEDMGPRPSENHSIDRINNEKGYAPSNCRWATHAEQSRNTRRVHWVDVEGKKMCLSDAAKVLGISKPTLRKRLLCAQ